jgi:putative colanic acid biosynthesis acetyltransferase WcaF
MARTAAYDASREIQAEDIADPYLRPAFSRKNQLMRVVWGVVRALLFRPSPRPLHAWRSFLLRCFGAQLGPNCHIYPKALIWAPWQLICADQVTLADDAEVYNPAPMHFGSHCIISQGAYLCGATHDYNSAAFPLHAYEMHFGAYTWICARAAVGPGVNVGEGAVLGMAAVTTRSLEPWTVYSGNPAVAVRERVRTTPDSIPNN